MLRQLQIWFRIHFVADILFALPLFFFPGKFMSLFGWIEIAPVMARLVAAALFGIGIESLIASYKADLKAFREMLNLKVIWSFTASAGLVIALIQGEHARPLMLWIITGIFILFHALWLSYRIRLK